jgi:hypothetical protein
MAYVGKALYNSIQGDDIVESKVFEPIVNGVPLRMVLRKHEKGHMEVLTSVEDVGSALCLMSPRRDWTEINIAIKKDHKLKLHKINGNDVLVGDIVFVAEMAQRAEYRMSRYFYTLIIDYILNEMTNWEQPAYNESKIGLDGASVSEHRFATTQIAKSFGMSATKLNDLLYRLGVQYKVNKQWVLKAEYADKGYVKTVPIHSDSEILNYHTYWSSAGVKFVEEILTNAGYVKNTQASIDISVNNQV